MSTLFHLSVGPGKPSHVLPVFWVIWRLVIICLHLGSISSLFLFCFKHCSMVLESASGQNLCKESKFYKICYPDMTTNTICFTLIEELMMEAAWRYHLVQEKRLNLNKHSASSSPSFTYWSMIVLTFLSPTSRFPTLPSIDCLPSWLCYLTWHLMSLNFI